MQIVEKYRKILEKPMEQPHRGYIEELLAYIEGPKEFTVPYVPSTGPLTAIAKPSPQIKRQIASVKRADEIISKAVDLKLTKGTPVDFEALQEEIDAR